MVAPGNFTTSRRQPTSCCSAPRWPPGARASANRWRVCRPDRVRCREGVARALPRRAQAGRDLRRVRRPDRARATAFGPGALDRAAAIERASREIPRLGLRREVQAPDGYGRRAGVTADATIPSLGGRTIAITEARRASELATLIGRLGGVAYSAPAVVEVLRRDLGPARAVLDRICAKEV